MAKTLALLMLIFLVGCDGFREEAAGRTRDAADDVARASLLAPCAMTVGAYNRLPQHERIAVDLLCGGNALKELQGLVGR